MMHLQAIISGVVLLLTAAVDSFPEVHGVVGHPVTLPCAYPVSKGLSSMCWGRGACASDTCEQTLIWTEGYRIYYRTNNRYQLKGHLLQGNVSLTIEDATESDSGFYCCRVETKNGVQRLTTSLQVQPRIPTSSPRRPTMIITSTTPTRPMTTTKPTTIPTRHTTTTRSTSTPTRPTDAPKSTRISTSTPPPPAVTLTPKPDWNSNVTSADHTWNKHTETFQRKPLRDTTKIVYVGISIAILLLLILASILTIAKYSFEKKKTGSLSLVAHGSKIRALQNTVVMRPRGEDKVYIMEDTLHVKD